MLSINYIILIIIIGIICYYIFSKKIYISENFEKFNGADINYHNNDDYNVYIKEPDQNNFSTDNNEN